MAQDTNKGDATHRHVFDLDVLDAETKNRVLACIEKRGKISVTVNIKGARNFGEGAFEQQID